MNRTALLALSMTAVLAPLGAIGAPTDESAIPVLRTGHWGFDLQGEDTRITPGDDFFGFANGGFLDALPMPADRSRYGIDPILADTAEKRVRMILESTKPLPGPAGADAQKARALYRAYMDEKRANALGAKPLTADLVKLRSIGSREQLAALMGHGQGGFEPAVFRVGITQDAKTPTHYAVSLSQGGLGLPDRDYYLKPGFAEKKAKYRDYIATMLKLADWSDADAMADAVLAFETRIAEVSWARQEERDPDKTYNPMSRAELEKLAPGFAWSAFLDASDLKGVNRIVVRENTAIPKIAAIYDGTPLPALKAWAAFHLADAASPFLSDDFEAARFAFRGAVLTGQPKDRERWKRAVGFDNRLVGEAVGRVYVAQYFPPEAKAKIRALVENLRTAMGERIRHLDWMSPATKTQALVKLSKLTVKLGYPDKWRDYGRLTVSPNDLYGDVKRAQGFEWQRRVRRLNQPVDKTEWSMTPQTVNAYYNPSSNEIVFPAAQLQAPYFDVGFDIAANYGGIGGVIGHEMTHGFDDEGRKFDATGKLSNWWTKEDAEKFEARAAVLGAQYDSFEPFPGAHVNGKLTMGENIADLGGVLIAMDAYHHALRGKTAPVVDGLTGDQRFLLAYAQSWREKAREDQVRQQVVSDPHSPERYRVNGVVRNLDSWYASFAVKPENKLYVAPDQRARIW